MTPPPPAHTGHAEAGFEVEALMRFIGLAFGSANGEVRAAAVKVAVQVRGRPQTECCPHVAAVSSAVTFGQFRIESPAGTTCSILPHRPPSDTSLAGAVF